MPPTAAKAGAGSAAPAPLWCDGRRERGGSRLRLALNTTDWDVAVRGLAAIEDNRITDIPMAEALEAFTAHARELSPSTQAKYGNTLRHLGRFAKTHRIVLLSQVTVSALDRYRAWRRSDDDGAPLGRLTAARELEIVRSFLSFCVDR